MGLCQFLFITIILIILILVSLLICKCINNSDKFTSGGNYSPNSLKKIRGAIIPHADENYAGDARKKVLDKIKKQNPSHIIYLATLHEGHGDNTYLLHKSLTFLSPTPFDNLPKTTDHSFDWVKDELPEIPLLVLGPSNNQSEYQWITKFLNDNPNSVLIGTVDLIHYGPKFNNVNYLKYPQQLNKMEKEESLLQALTEVNSEKLKQALEDDLSVTDGPYVLKLFINIMNELKINSGKIVDYYDSHTIDNANKDKLQRYEIDIFKIPTLVSYVSIIYGPNIKQSDIEDVDIMMAIGLVKSVIKNDVYKKMDKATLQLRLPKWSPFYNKTHGIFVGTSIENKTNCSYGQYEDEHNVSDKIVSASKSCFNDAKYRWENPYREDLIDKMNYKVEFLQPKSEWKEHTARYATDPTVFDFKSGEYGIYLTLPSGLSATYLPVVSKDMNNIITYMESLSEKAGGNKDGWKHPNAKINVYKTESYIWNTKKQIIEYS